MSVSEETVNKFVEEVFKTYDNNQNQGLGRIELQKLLDKLYKSVRRPTSTIYEISDLMKKFD